MFFLSQFGGFELANDGLFELTIRIENDKDKQDPNVLISILEDYFLSFGYIVKVNLLNLFEEDNDYRFILKTKSPFELNQSDLEEFLNNY